MARRRHVLAGFAVGLGALAIGWWGWAGEDDERTAFAGELTTLDGVVPAPSGIALPPGSPVGLGLEVAEGSHLLGGPLPYLYSTMHGGDPIEDDGFQAYLLVTDPIREVIERYRTQATDAGFVMTPVWCVQSSGVLQCSTTCSESCGFEAGYERGRTLAIGGEQGSGSGAVPPQSWAIVDYREVGSPPFPTEEGIFAPADLSDLPGMVPADWPALPGVGDPIYSFSDFTVPTGTVLLAHGLRVANETSGTTAIFEVVDDIGTVIERFAAQESFRPDDLHRSSFAGDGVRVEMAWWNNGRGQGLTFYDLADGPTILVLSLTSSD